LSTNAKYQNLPGSNGSPADFLSRYRLVNPGLAGLRNCRGKPRSAF
jgi:hypothetical protein